MAGRFVVGRKSNTYKHFGYHPAASPHGISSQPSGLGTLTRLPPELRLMIYEFAMSIGQVYHIHGKTLALPAPGPTAYEFPTLLLASKSVRNESHGIFTMKNTFIIRTGNPVLSDDRPITRAVQWLRKMMAHSGKNLQSLHICPPTGFWAYVPQYLELFELALHHKFPLEIMNYDKNQRDWPVPTPKFTITKGRYGLVAEFLEDAQALLNTAITQKWNATRFATRYSRIEFTLSKQPNRPRPAALMQQPTFKAPSPKRVVLGNTTLFEGTDFLLYVIEADAQKSIYKQMLQEAPLSAWKTHLPALGRIRLLIEESMPPIEGQRQALLDEVTRACNDRRIALNSVRPYGIDWLNSVWAYDKAFVHYDANEGLLELHKAYLRANIAAATVPHWAARKLRERQRVLAALRNLDRFWDSEAPILPQDFQEATLLISQLSKVNGELTAMGVTF